MLAVKVGPSKKNNCIQYIKINDFILLAGASGSYIVRSIIPHKIIRYIYYTYTRGMPLKHTYMHKYMDIEISQWGPDFGIKSIFNMIIYIMEHKNIIITQYLHIIPTSLSPIIYYKINQNITYIIL